MYERFQSHFEGILISFRIVYEQQVKWIWGAHVEEAPFVTGLKDQHGEGRYEQRAEETGCTELPCQLSLSCPGEHPLHDSDYVKGGQDVEDLEDAVVQDSLPEEISVTRQKDDAIEDLCNERDTWSRVFVSSYPGNEVAW